MKDISMDLGIIATLETEYASFAFFYRYCWRARLSYFVDWCLQILFGFLKDPSTDCLTKTGHKVSMTEIAKMYVWLTTLQ